MRKPLNILSIDWDYFVNATEEQRIMDFPDANDNLSQELNKIVWSGRYADNDELSDIGVTVNEFDEVKQYLTKVRNQQNTHDIEVMVTNSHKYIYDFITERMDRTSYTDVPIRMFHIDYHSDFYGMEEVDNSPRELDCGNWLNYLCERLKGRAFKFSNVMWMAREDSERDVDMPKIMSRVTYDPTSDDLCDMLDFYFHCNIPDLIFLCKSNPWSPPHIDDKFDELFDILKGVGRCRYSSDIENRYTKEFTDLVKKHKRIRRLSNKFN